jgi:hypothetical protein
MNAILAAILVWLRTHGISAKLVNVERDGRMCLCIALENVYWRDGELVKEG